MVDEDIHPTIGHREPFDVCWLGRDTQEYITARTVSKPIKGKPFKDAGQACRADPKETRLDPLCMRVLKICTAHPVFRHQIQLLLVYLNLDYQQLKYTQMTLLLIRMQRGWRYICFFYVNERKSKLSMVTTVVKPQADTCSRIFSFIFMYPSVDELAVGSRCSLLKCHRVSDTVCFKSS